MACIVWQTEFGGRRMACGMWQMAGSEWGPNHNYS